MMELPHQVKTALTTLEAAGFEAYVVGGAVRDYVRGKIPAKDWDIATNALPEEVERIFQEYRIIETGLQHGTVTVLIGGEPLEITTYRIDGAYSDHRRPDKVSFTPSLKEDMRRRDFTMNALAYNPRTGIVDFFGGAKDIASGSICCVGNPDCRFREDGLRIMRALRFASVFDMELNEHTASAIHRNRELLLQISSERIQTELTKALCGQNVQTILRIFADVFAVVIPHLAPMFGFNQHNMHHDKDVWEHTIAVVSSAPPVPVLRWAALLHDIGKPDCFTLSQDGTGHFYGHAQKSAEIADAVLSRLHFDTTSRQRIVLLIRHHDAPIPPDPRAIKRLLSKLGADTLRQLIELHMADTMGQSPMCRDRLGSYDKVCELLDDIIKENACFTLKSLAVNGHDMMLLGLRGKAVGAALDSLLCAVMDGTIPNEHSALLEYARKSAPNLTL